MKKLIKIILFLVTMFIFSEKTFAYGIISEKHQNYGPNTCREDNAYWNPVETQLGTAGNSSHAIIYDVTWVKMDGDVMKIYGWAFDKGKNNDGNNGIQIIASTATNVSKISSSKNMNFHIAYAKEGQNANGKGLTYYDLSYWNCFRNEHEICMSNNMEMLRGGFEASLNLNNLEEGVYRVYLKVGNEVGWTELTASKTAEDQSVKNYSADSIYDIDISGFGDKATIKVDYGRLSGENGLLCSSPVTKTNRDYSYFVDEASYTIAGVTTACRGDCKNTKINFSQRLFKLNVSSTYSIKGIKAYYGPGNGMTAYAPASWLNFSGHVKISKVKKVNAETCADNVEKMECTESGNKATFKENEDLTNCTIPEDHSGFTLISNDYCDVACKDDFETYLPNIKNVIAGQYFTLDDYQPSITGKRTCVTSKIKVEEFKSDLKTQGQTMVDYYNIYTDYEYIQDHLTGSKGVTTSGSMQTTCKTPKIEDGKEVGCAEYNYCHYTTYSWTINPVIRDGRNIYSGDSGRWYSKCYSSDGTLESNLSSVKEDYDPSVPWNLYESAKSTYKNIQTSYNECSNWIDEYDYGFNPTVSFSYEDEAAQIFSSTKYTYQYSDISKQSYPDETYYWTIDTMNNNYEPNGQGTKTEKLDVYSCSGDYCDDDASKKTFNANTYIRRNEKISYTYTLPQLYTSVPSGKIEQYPSSKNYLILDENIVPIDVNTTSGIYNYYLEITDFADEIREDKQKTELNDRIEKLYFNDVNNTYTCEYNVKNDIYLPKDGKINYFYRTVDLANINPLNRTLGYNWNNVVGQKVQDDIKESDTNKGALTSKDVFTFVLTPAIMEKIRDYNSSEQNNGGYLNWDSGMTCSDYDKNGYYCTSEFLTCLASGGAEADCYEIFGSALNNYNKLTDYDTNKLNDNRELLLDKMNSLIGR